MTTLQLADNIYPSLHLTDTVADALQLMSDSRANHLPVVSEEIFLGLVSENDLNDEKDKKLELEKFQSNFILSAAVYSNNFFLKAAAVYSLYQTNVIPVVNESNELQGTISSGALIKALGSFCGSSEFGAIIVLEMERTRYAVSEINSLVESDGATILHLNVTPHPSPNLIKVTLQINKREISTILATFERYSYSVSYYSGEELFEDDLDLNYNNLMNYLQI